MDAVARRARGAEPKTFFSLQLKLFKRVAACFIYIYINTHNVAHFPRHVDIFRGFNFYGRRWRRGGGPEGAGGGWLLTQETHPPPSSSPPPRQHSGAAGFRVLFETRYDSHSLYNCENGELGGWKNVYHKLSNEANATQRNTLAFDLLWGHVTSGTPTTIGQAQNVADL